MFRFDQLFKRADAVERHLAAPLAVERLAYLAHRAEQGARPSTLRGTAALQIKIIQYLELDERGRVARPAIEAAARRWVSEDPARRGGKPDVARRHFVSHATGWLRFSGRLNEPARSAHPYSGAVADFVDYMRHERGWSEATIRDRGARADAFLRRFCTRTGALADVTVATIDRALCAHHARTGHPRCRTTIRTHADALRAFFRFAEDRNWSRPGTAAAIAVPRVYRDAALPVGPSREEQRLLLASTERDGPADLRDRALLLTLLAYGLRAGEALNLTLLDTDLRTAILTVRRTKFDKARLVPLGPHLARAMREYAVQRKAGGASQAHDAPFFINRDGTPPAARTVSKAFVHLRRAAGVGHENGTRNPPRLHDLRHSFAVHRLTAWYRQGADVQRMLPLLSTYLGDASIAGTQAYLTMTPELLGKAAQRYERYVQSGTGGGDD